MVYELTSVEKYKSFTNTDTWIARADRGFFTLFGHGRDKYEALWDLAQKITIYEKEFRYKRIPVQ